MKNNKILILFAFLAIGAFSATQAQTIVYSDTFDGSASSPLNGTTPNVTTGGNTWVSQHTSGVIWNADGSINGDGAATLQRNAKLAFTPESGKIYTYSVDVTLTASGHATDYISMGFHIGTGNAETDNPAGMRYRPGDNTLYLIRNGALDSGLSAPTVSGAGSYKLVLDTRGTAWTVDYYINDLKIDSGVFTTNPTTIDSIYINQYRMASGSVDNLLLTVIPEPATYAFIGGLLALGLVVLRRRNRLVI